MKEFKLLGKKIKRDVGEDNYNLIRLTAERLADKYQKEFHTNFYNKFSNMDSVINGVEDYGNTFILRIIEWGVSFLNQNKIYSYDTSRFIDEYCGDYIEPWFEACQDIEDQYNEINMTKEEAMEYRSQRKSSRGRIVGGGFGISGAAKGIAMAGAANLATGMAHSAVNAVGNIASSISASVKKGSLYKNSETRNTYAEGLHAAMSDLHYAVAQALNNNSDCPVTFLKKNAVNEADAIFKNIKKGIVPKEDIPDQIAKAISLYPYNEEVYDYLLDTFGDKEGEILAISEYFGSSLAERIFTSIEQEFVELDFLNKETLISSKSSISEVCSHYGIPDMDYLEAIDKLILMHEENSKTVDSVTYPDNETADKVRAELAQLVKHVEKISGNNEELVNSIIAEAGALRCETKDKYLKYLHSALERADDRYKTVKGVLFKDRETAAKARIEAAEIEELFRNSNFKSLGEIQSLRQTVSGYETDIKAMFLEKLDAMMDIWHRQDDLALRYQSFYFEKRKYFSDLYYIALGLNRESEAVSFLNENYINWFYYMEEIFMTIKGERYHSAEEANKKYYTVLSHAVSYLNYTNEKNGPKKGFLSSLKNNISGVVVKNYDVDFYYITNNGTLPMPKDTKEEGEELVRQHVKFMSDIASRANSYSSLLQKMAFPTALQDENLSIGQLVIDTPPVSAKEIEAVVNGVCKYEKLTLKQEVANNNGGKTEYKPNTNNANSNTGSTASDHSGTTASDHTGTAASNNAGKVSSYASADRTFHKTDMVKITITDIGANKVAVIKALRTWMGYELKTCVDLLDNLPYTMEGEYKVSDADLVRKQFDEAGATVKYTLASDPEAPESNIPE